MSSNLEATKRAVVDAYRRACREYDNALNLETRDMAANAKPGQTMTTPKQATGRYFDMANMGVSRAREDALDAIGKARKRAGGKLVEAPTTEAANYCATLQGRDDLTADEVNAALSRYTNHAAQQAILSAARRSGLDVVGSSDAQSDIDTLDGLERLVNRNFSAIDIGNTSEGKRSFLSRQMETYAADRDEFDQLRELLNG